MDDKLLIKYLSGQTTEEEQDRVLNWVESDPNNQLKFNRLKNAWVMSRLPHLPAPEEKVRQYGQQLRRRQQTRRFLSYGIAASLVILLSVGGINKLKEYKQQIAFLQNQTTAQLEYHTNKGVKGYVTLPDGSTVWLNSDSELKCPAIFTGNEREISFSGEGFFDVVKNPDKPMVVRLENNIRVVVKGTKFNLASYKNDDHISALLLSGNITVVRTQDEKHEEIKVKPNEQVSIKKNQSQETNLTIPAETFPILGWKEGWLIFNETPVSEVLKKLERWHGINFEVHDPEILNQKFSARFHEESITQILEMMKGIALLQYELKDKTAILYKY